jgi:hypothetical protein
LHRATNAICRSSINYRSKDRSILSMISPRSPRLSALAIREYTGVFDEESGMHNFFIFYRLSEWNCYFKNNLTFQIVIKSQSNRRLKTV